MKRNLYKLLEIIPPMRGVGLVFLIYTVYSDIVLISYSLQKIIRPQR